MDLKQIKTKAEELSSIRKDIDTIELELKVKTEQLKFKRDKIQNELINALKESELKSIKVASGENYSMGVRKSFVINDNSKALEWAKENKVVSVDKREAEKIIKTLEEIPTGFEIKETEFISIRLNKND